jgi:hypothetical protein
MSEEENIIYKVELLESLIAKQTALINTSDQIIQMKNRMIELADQEVSLYRRENASLKIMCGIGFVLIVVMCFTMIHMLQ